MEILQTDIELAKQGDRDAFGKLYDSVALDLYKFALYQLGNTQDAEDAVSETFIEAYRGIKNLRDINSFKPWIFRILSFRCKRKIGGYIKEKGNIDIDDYRGESSSGEEYLSAQISEALQKLNDEERELVVLSAVHGYTMREIAEMKLMPQGTVSSKLHRSLKKLRKYLED